MKTIITVIIVPIILVIAFFSFLSCSSRPPKVQLINGKLRPCPSTPNCVSSESEAVSSRVDPLAFGCPKEKAWAEIKNAILEMGGNIQQDKEGFLWATFTSTVFRFVDDVELRMDKGNSLIHVRSASRVGHSDMGVNRNRVEKLRILFNQKTAVRKEKL